MKAYRLSLIFLWLVTAAEIACAGLIMLVNLPPGVVNFAHSARYSLPLALLGTAGYWYKSRHENSSSTEERMR